VAEYNEDVMEARKKQVSHRMKSTEERRIERSRVRQYARAD
jgi:hypothetical protein